MAGIDLSTFRFDYDTTFAAVFMNPNGHVYHLYGGRDETGPLSHISMESMAATMRRTVADHAAYDPAADPPPAGPATTVEDLPPMARRIAKDGRPDCIHCHTVNEMRREDAVARDRWTTRDAWRWPPARRVGIVLDRDDQQLVREVLSGTPAATAGLREGDRLVRVGGRAVATQTDVQGVLDETPWGPAQAAVVYERGGERREATLRLKEGWKDSGPLGLAHRNIMWSLSPSPGFGGAALTPEQKTRLGLPAEGFAFRVSYIVTWGRSAHTGRNAKQAGIRKGDVCLSFDGKSDFESERHWQAWFRLTRKVGKKVQVEVLRDGKRLTVGLPVIE